jgi:hypothetical protein
MAAATPVKPPPTIQMCNGRYRMRQASRVCLLGIAVKWMRLGNQRQNLDVFSRCYATGLLMRTAR